MPVSAKHLNYYDYDPDAALTCPSCGWSGQRGATEFFNELFDVRCPECDQILLIVPYPTSEETRAAAAAGNARAQADLPAVDKRDARLERAEASELRDPDQLPELEGDRLIIEWDFEERDGEHWTVLRHEDRPSSRSPSASRRSPRWPPPTPESRARPSTAGEQWRGIPTPI